MYSEFPLNMEQSAFKKAYEKKKHIVQPNFEVTPNCPCFNKKLKYCSLYQIHRYCITKTSGLCRLRRKKKVSKADTVEKELSNCDK